MDNKTKLNFILILCILFMLAIVRLENKEFIKKVRSDSSWCTDFCNSLDEFDALYFDGEGCYCYAKGTMPIIPTNNTRGSEVKWNSS